MPEPGLVDGATIVLPSLIGIVLSYLMLSRSYRRARDIGMKDRTPSEKKQLRTILTIFVWIPFAYSLLELLVYLKAVGVMDGGYDSELLTGTVGLGCAVAGLGGFLLTSWIGMACAMSNRKEFEQLAARRSEANAEEVPEGRDPVMVRKLILKLSLYQVLAILVLVVVIWLMRVDTSAWDEEARLVLRTII